MSIQASVILDQAASLLLDTAHRTWSADDLLDYLNEAMRMTAGAKADFYTVQEFVDLVPGLLQELPGDGVAVMNVTRNSSANGGRIVTQVDESLLAESARFWPAATTVTQIEHYTADPRSPRRFKVFPPAALGASVEVLYSTTPPQVMYAAEVLPVSEVYQSPLTDFVLAKAYMKNTKRQDLTKSSGFMAQWGQKLGLKANAQAAVAPKVAVSPGVA